MEYDPAFGKRDIRKALEINPSSFEAHFTQIILYEKLNRFDKVGDLYDKILC